MEDESSKKALRRKYKEIRSGFGKVYKNEAGRLICERLVRVEEFKSSTLILTYVSTENEADTSGIIKTALGLGKKVAVPLCNTQKHTMNFFVISSIDALVKGSYGIMEPNPDSSMKIDAADGFCVVPGLAFDTCGSRLGQGGGYYDRFLESFKGVTAGICFSAQLSAEPLICEKHDVKMNMIITENEVIRN